MILMPGAKRIYAGGCILCAILVIITGCAPSIRYTRDSALGKRDTGQQNYSEKITDELVSDISVSGIPSDRLQSVISSYIGAPYRLGGMSAKGFDCSGFGCLVYKKVFNVSLPRSSSQMQHCGRRISLKDASAGDLIFFRNYRIGRIGHVGIYMGEGRFAHASVKHGVRYSDLREPYYKKRLAMIRRIFK